VDVGDGGSGVELGVGVGTDVCVGVAEMVGFLISLLACISCVGDDEAWVALGIGLGDDVWVALGARLGVAVWVAAGVGDGASTISRLRGATLTQAVISSESDMIVTERPNRSTSFTPLNLMLQLSRLLKLK
jgi:hypothetical protein